MNIDYLSEFVHLAGSLSFRRTAEHFYVSRSVISRHLHALEESLGTVLLERTAQGVALTEAGKVFLQDAQTVLRDWELACTRVKAVSGDGDKLVRVGYLRNAARPFLAHFVQSMAHHHPEVHLSRCAWSTRRPDRPWRTAPWTIAIGLNVNESLSNNYRSTLVYEDRFVAACSRSHPVAKGDSVTLDALRDVKCLVPDSYVAAGLASVASELIDDDALAEPESVYKDMDLLYLKLQTEECVAFVSASTRPCSKGRWRYFP